MDDHPGRSHRSVQPQAQRGAFVVLTAIIFLAGCRLGGVPGDDETLVSSLRFSPSAFDSFRRNTEMKFNLRSPATVSLYIVKKDSAAGELLVKTLAEGLRQTKGSHAVTWLGDTDGRFFAPAGIYLGVVAAGGRRFETTIEVFHF